MSFADASNSRRVCRRGACRPSAAAKPARLNEGGLRDDEDSASHRPVLMRPYQSNCVVPPILNNLDELGHRLAMADQRLVRVRRCFDQLLGRSGRRQPDMARFQVAAYFGNELTEGFA